MKSSELIQNRIEECLNNLESGTGKLIEGLKIRRSNIVDIEKWANNLAKEVSGLTD